MRYPITTESPSRVTEAFMKEHAKLLGEGIKSSSSKKVLTMSDNVFATQKRREIKQSQKQRQSE